VKVGNFPRVIFTVMELTWVMIKSHKGLIDFPYRKPKNRELDEEEKEYNRGISRFRVRIEHILGQLKIFKCLSERYRYPRKNYNLKFNIIAGISNLKNGF
jgi:hypothetical protein